MILAMWQDLGISGWETADCEPDAGPELYFDVEGMGWFPTATYA